MSRSTLIYYPAETPDILLSRCYDENNNIVFFVRRDVDFRYLVLVYIHPETKTIKQRRIQDGEHAAAFILTSLILHQVIPADSNTQAYDLAKHQAVIDLDFERIRQTSRWKERRNAIVAGFFDAPKLPEKPLDTPLTSPLSSLCSDDREGGVFSPFD